MDRALDEVIGEKQWSSNRGGRNRRPNNWSRDGPRKNGRDDSTNIDDDWLHDKYDDEPDSRRSNRSPQNRRNQGRDDPEDDLIGQGTKLRVENLHYDLTEDDLEDLFSRIAPVISLSLRYDRAGRSTGTAFVTYGSAAFARTAIREYDGANANGQPIHLTLMPANNAGTGGRSVRNPFDTAVRPSRSLFDRIEEPRGRNGGQRERSRSRSPGAPRRSDTSKPPPDGVDRYVPGRLSRSRSPLRRARNGSGRRDGGGRRDNQGGRRGGGSDRNDRRDGGRPIVNGRPRMTQEELDKEMDLYWSSNKDEASGTTMAAGSSSKPAINVEDGDIDIDMAE